MKGRDVMKCCLCEGEIEVQRNALGEVVWDQGHNPYPISKREGDRACDRCNAFLVIPARYRQIIEARK